MAKKGVSSSSVPKVKSLGKLAFVIGVIVAILSGLFLSLQSNPLMISVLVILGAIVGLFNVTTKETQKFLFASVSLVIISALGAPIVAQIPSFGIYFDIEGMLLAILTFVIPAAIIVAIKTIYTIEED